MITPLFSNILVNTTFTPVIYRDCTKERKRDTQTLVSWLLLLKLLNQLSQKMLRAYPIGKIEAFVQRVVRLSRFWWFCSEHSAKQLFHLFRRWSSSGRDSGGWSCGGWSCSGRGRNWRCGSCHCASGWNSRIGRYRGAERMEKRVEKH